MQKITMDFTPVLIAAMANNGSLVSLAIDNKADMKAKRY